MGFHRSVAHRSGNNIETELCVEQVWVQSSCLHLRMRLRNSRCGAVAGKGPELGKPTHGHFFPFLCPRHRLFAPAGMPRKHVGNKFVITCLVCLTNLCQHHCCRERRAGIATTCKRIAVWSQDSELGDINCDMGPAAD